jgi:hypothetical protein
MSRSFNKKEYFNLTENYKNKLHTYALLVWTVNIPLGGTKLERVQK